MHLEGKGRFARQHSWMLVLCLAPVPGFAQQVAEPTANSEILKLHWERQVTLPRNFDPAVIPTNPLDATRSATARTGAAASTGSAFPATPGRLPISYPYSLKIRNTSDKLIQAIAWDYLFIDSRSNAELGKHQFLSFAKVSPQRIATLKAQLRSPPIRILRGGESEKNPHPKFTERALVQCILFADETVWQNPFARPGVCELLKNSKALTKRKAA